VIAIAGDGDDRNGVDGSSEFNAIHFRHREVCKNQTYVRFGCDQPKRFPSTLGWYSCKSKKIEHPEEWT
jgi:hypothetical protein